MPKQKRILAVDVGASKVVVAEFLTAKSGNPELVNYGIGNLDIDPERDQHSGAIIASTLRDIMRDYGIRPAPLRMTISGQTVFPRFVKLPPVTSDKLKSIVQYEAEQNVPFPINEVVWDYQLLRGRDPSDTNVMLVAAKVDNVTALTHSVGAAHLEPEIVDAAPMALYNAVCHNYSDAPGCTMLLDFGARSSNLIFVEENRVFSRSVPVSGNTITSEIAKMFNIPFADAEALKLEHAEVGLGGVYEGPEEETAAQIAKIVRNVVTRLHAEVNRSINFYRSQQGGSPPSQVLLTGGSSIMPNIDVFFSEKLKVDVDYFNPFVNVVVGAAIDEERISAEAHLLGEVVGLALREMPACPVQINLMPPDLVALKTFRRRLPYFGAAAAGLILALTVVWMLNSMTIGVREKQLKDVNKRLEEIRTTQGRLDQARARNQAVKVKANDLSLLIASRTTWLDIIRGVRDSLLPGMWVRQIDVPSSAVEEVASFELTVAGFEDLLREFDSEQKTAAEVFRDRLNSDSRFSDKTEITRQPLPKPHLRELTMHVVLAASSADAGVPGARNRQAGQ